MDSVFIMANFRSQKSNPLVLCQFLNELMDGCDLIDAVGIGTAENEAVVYIALFRIHIHFFEGVSGAQMATKRVAICAPERPRER